MPDLKKYREIISGCVLLCVSLFYLYHSFFIKIMKKKVFYNSAMFPKMLGIALAVLSICQIVNAVIKFRRERAAGQPETSAPAISRSGAIRIAATLIALVIYLAGMRQIGFLIMTCFYVCIQTLILAPKGKLSIPLLLVLSTVFPAAVYFLFVYGFQLMLPKGFLTF